MPQAVLPAVIAAAGSAATAAIAGTAITIGSLALAAGGSLLMSGAQMLLSSGSKKGKTSIAAQASGSVQNVKQAITPHTIVYGQRRVGGPVVFIASSSGNLYLHVLVILACHEVESIGEVWFDEDSIPPDFLDVNGNVSAGKYEGTARIIKHLGSSGQSADAQLIAEVPEWTANDKLSGLAYLYVRLKWSQQIYQRGIPNITAVVKGKKIFDSRDSITRYTPNAMLIARDYLTDGTYGYEVASSYIDSDSVDAGANICDEMVTTESVALTVLEVTTAAPDTLELDCDVLTLYEGDRVQVTSSGSLPGGISALTNYFVIPYQIGTAASTSSATAVKPRIRLATSLANAIAGTHIDITSTGSGTITVTKNAEPRYHAAAAVDTSQTLGSNMIGLLSGFNGRVVYAGGVWRFINPSYTAPTFTLSEDDIIAPLSVQTKVGRSERFNQIKGVFSSQQNLWQPADYPSVTDNAAEARDGQILPRDYDLPATFRPTTAQRIAKVELKKAVQEITVKAVCNLRALNVQTGDVIQVTNTQFGWTDKLFEVVSFRLTFAVGQIAIELDLRETAADIYDWSSSEESDIDSAPNTDLPSAFIVEAVTGLAFDSVPLATRDGDEVYNILLTWSAHPNAFVLSGGRFEVQYKESSNAFYQPSFYVDGELTSSTIAVGSSGVEYDVRIRAVNNIGARSEWQTLTGVITGSSGGVGTTNNWQAVTDSVTTNLNWQAVTDTVTTSDDWGSIT